MKKQMWGSFVAILLAVACGGIRPPKPQPPPTTSVTVAVTVTDVAAQPLAGATVWDQQKVDTKYTTDAAGHATVPNVSLQTGVCAQKEGYHSPGIATKETCKVAAGAVSLMLQAERPPEPETPPLPKVHADGKVFRLANGQAWRWKGVSAFPLIDKWKKGQDIQPYLDAYKGYNLLRVWPYVPVRDWGTTAWDSPTPAEAVAFVRYVNSKGWYVEFSLLTDDDAVRVPQAKAFIAAFKAANLQGTLFLEAGNEPEVQKPGHNYDTSVLRADLQTWGGEYASGNYTNAGMKWWGTYLTTHTQRDSEWPRRSHDCYDYWVHPNDAPAGSFAIKAPCVLDEPAKLEDVGGKNYNDWLGYFGSGSNFGGGLTFHCNSCKYGNLPTADEREMAQAALFAMNAFPADSPLGPYSRPSDSSLRTYIVGNYMTRIRPTTPNAPVAGFTEIENHHVLWRR